MGVIWGVAVEVVSLRFRRNGPSAPVAEAVRHAASATSADGRSWKICYAPKQSVLKVVQKNGLKGTNSPLHSC